MTSFAQRILQPLFQRHLVRAMVPVALVAIARPTRAAPREEPRSELVAVAEQKTGAEAYLAVQTLWHGWDEGDPLPVQAGLSHIATHAGSADVRAYAGIFRAFGARRRGDLAQAKAITQALGYVTQWSYVGPFDNEGKVAFLEKLPPEQGVSEGASFVGKDHHRIRMQKVPDVFPYGWVDLGALIRPTEKVCAFLSAKVRDRSGRARSARIAAGAGGVMRIFWNGKEVLREEAYRELSPDRWNEGVELRKGDNELVVKLCGDERAPSVSLRISNAQGDPDPNLVVEASPTFAPLTADPKAPSRRGVLGSLPGAEPEVQARLLDLTHADTPTEKRVLSLLHQAVAKSPNIRTLLFLGEQSEDRNREQGHLEHARTLLGKEPRADDRIEFLRREAALVRSSAVDSGALQAYDKVLALAPHDVKAHVARADILEDLGLRETALASLDHALSENPRAAALLRRRAALLSAAGRDREALQAWSMLATVRFDDIRIHTELLQLAARLGQADVVEHVAKRVTELAPDALGLSLKVARAWVTLGDRPRARAVLARALEVVPDDVDLLKEQAEVLGLMGKRAEARAHLERLLLLSPQAKGVRDYLALMNDPARAKDEAYARPRTEFLKDRDVPSGGASRRTLCRVAVTEVFDNGLASRFYQDVFQPLTQKAAEASRDYPIGFEGEWQTVDLRGARVFRKGGEVIETFETFEVGTDDPESRVYTTGRAKVIRLPTLAPGDVVEVQYRIEDVAYRNAFADYFGEIVPFEAHEPILRSEYVLRTPKDRPFFLRLPAKLALEKGEHLEGGTRVRTYRAKDIPEVPREPLAPPLSEVGAHIHVSTFKNWQEVGSWYRGLIRDQFVADDAIVKKVRALTAGLSTPREKVEALYEWVVERTRYVALEFGIHGYKPYACPEIFARGFGDCKDKATLLITMLREAGIEAHMTIVRTGHKGLIDKDPASLAPFDHAIAYVPSLGLYLDGTAEHTGMGELPAMDRGAVAFVVGKEQTDFVRLPDPPPEEGVFSLEAQIAQGQSATLDITMKVPGVEAASFRAQYAADATRKTRLSALLTGFFPGAELVSETHSAFSNLRIPVTLHMKAKTASFGQKDQGKVTYPLTPRPFLTRAYAEARNRTLPLRLPALLSQKFVYTLHVPDGTFELPEGKAGESPFGRYQTSFERTGKHITGQTILALSKRDVSPEEYTQFRSFCMEADRALGGRAALSGKP